MPRAVLDYPQLYRSSLTPVKMNHLDFTSDQRYQVMRQAENDRFFDRQLCILISENLNPDGCGRITVGIPGLIQAEHSFGPNPYLTPPFNNMTKKWSDEIWTPRKKIQTRDFLCKRVKRFLTAKHKVLDTTSLLLLWRHHEHMIKLNKDAVKLMITKL